jgi:uncharacterized protein
MQLISFLISKTNLPSGGIQNTVQLLNEDCTIPFIARYRKERTGNLDEVQIGTIVKYKAKFDELEKRKRIIVKALDEQDALTEELSRKIAGTVHLNVLEDIYLPFKKKRKTRAETARMRGLEPLAKVIMSQRANDLEDIASMYIDRDVKTGTDALEGARHIMAEWINERSGIRSNIRIRLEKFATINTKVITSKEQDEKAQKYRDYFNWSEPLNRCPSHRLLAILRAEKEGFIRVHIAIDDDKAIASMEG